MVGRAGEGIGSHGFSCGSHSGSSTSVDSVVDVCSGYIRCGFVDKSGGIAACVCSVYYDPTTSPSNMP